MTSTVAQDVLFLHALTPVSPGTGTSIDVIDQPIAREKPTTFPFVPGATIKGVLRAGLEPPERSNAPGGQEARDLWLLAFGPEPKNAREHAGALVFADARLLLFPVRSGRGVFTWVTSPLVWRRCRRDLPGGADAPGFASTLDVGRIAVPESSVLLNGDRALLEDLDLTREPSATHEAGAIAGWLAPKVFKDPQEQQDLRQRFALLADDTFTYLVQTATEVVARIRLQRGTHTVDEGGLWYEEALPTETVLSCLVLAYPARQARKEVSASKILSVLDGVTEGTWTIGGKETVGRGRVRFSRIEAPRGNPR